MLIPRLKAPIRAIISSTETSSAINSHVINCTEALRRLFITSSRSSILTSIRHASHQAQGRANGAKDGPGKRLGAKKTGEQYVIPGNIIFRQRGTHWYPGENVGMGRDHTIYAAETGYVKYYKDPERHPKRKYIGVVFERDQSLPLPRNAARRRRLGMFAVQMDPALSAAGDVVSDLVVGKGMDASSIREVPAGKRASLPKKELVLRPGYMYREANWEIGRAAERANVKVRQFRPRDRFTAWRKAAMRKSKNAEKRGMRRK
ncbi:MAG: 54S ribosomal protein L2 mitochondrial [Pycnora praestabilis]|nr:MAG: 54S ribosomal protein L2 mitochondrial [Pycnora praestabilis]